LPVEFAKRFSNFVDAQLRSLKIKSPTEIDLTIAVQDRARNFDWITLTLHFYGVSDANLPNEKELDFIDMSDGATLLKENGDIAFASGQCYNIKSIKNQRLYIIASSFKSTQSPY
jgi:urease accessory protein UreE